MKKFYIANAAKVNTEEKTLAHALDSLESGMSENEEGWIKCFQFIDDDEIEYEQIYHIGYIKKNGKLIITERW